MGFCCFVAVAHHTSDADHTTSHASRQFPLVHIRMSQADAQQCQPKLCTSSGGEERDTHKKLIVDGADDHAGAAGAPEARLLVAGALLIS